MPRNIYVSKYINSKTLEHEMYLKLYAPKYFSKASYKFSSEVFIGTVLNQCNVIIYRHPQYNFCNYVDVNSSTFSIVISSCSTFADFGYSYIGYLCNCYTNYYNFKTQTFTDLHSIQECLEKINSIIKSYTIFEYKKNGYQLLSSGVGL